MTINQDNTLSCIEIEPALPAKWSIIWLHGLGADGNDFVPLIPQLKHPTIKEVRFVFPNAPVMAVTLNQGYEMPAWFDIYAITKDAKIDAPGIATSVAAIEKLIEKEIARGIPANHIILAGFSQGAAIALITGMGYSQSIAGMIALSGFLPMANEVLQKANPTNRQTPIFIAHGTEDWVVPFAFGKATYTLLKQANYPIEWHQYAMAHSVCEAEIDDLNQWLQGVIRE